MSEESPGRDEVSGQGGTEGKEVEWHLNELLHSSYISILPLRSGEVQISTLSQHFSKLKHPGGANSGYSERARRMLLRATNNST
jgi:hypothetical protein